LPGAVGQGEHHPAATGGRPDPDTGVPMNLSAALTQRLAGQPYGLNRRTGMLYTASEIIPCLPSEGGWIADPARAAVRLSIPAVPVVERGQ
jgi:hypothetical protein